MKKGIDFSSLEKAIFSLESSVKAPPKNDLERDGVIQRFEYTFELCWKFIRKFLLALGRKELSASPKPLIRDAAEEGIIHNVEDWFMFLETRNTTTHTYNQKEAERIYKIAKAFAPEAQTLLKNLKEREKIWT